MSNGMAQLVKKSSALVNINEPFYELLPSHENDPHRRVTAQKKNNKK
jgi:hypothetical protein